MYDGFKICNLIAPDILKNEYLNFSEFINANTGEIAISYAPQKYKSLKFTHKNNNTKLEGSLHKYFNEGLHNYDDFQYEYLLLTIKDLWGKFKINPAINQLNNLEFGVNIISPYSFEEIKQSIISHRGKSFKEFNINGAKGIMCFHNDYIFKIYDKSHQNKLPQNIIRYELKVIKMKFFSENGIPLKYLYDLLVIDFELLGKLLLKKWDEILFTNLNIPQIKLKQHEKILLVSGSNPNFWESLKPKSKKFKGNRKNKEYQKQRKKYYNLLGNFKQLISKHSTQNIQSDFHKLIDSKWKELSTIDVNAKEESNLFCKQFISWGTNYPCIP